MTLFTILIIVVNVTMKKLKKTASFASQLHNTTKKSLVLHDHWLEELLIDSNITIRGSSCTFSTYEKRFFYNYDIHLAGMVNV